MRTALIINPRIIFYLLLAMVATSGCTHPELAPSDYNAWVENESNQLKQVREFDQIAYQLQYKPVDYILNIEEKYDKDRSDRLKELEGMHYFQLKLYDPGKTKGDLLRNNVGSQGEHQEAIYYFSYLFGDQIYMVEGQDTLLCELYHFVRGHGLSPDLNFVFGFPDSGKNIDRQLVIHDDFFSNGLVKFNYDRQLLNNIPTLNDQLL